MRKTVERETGSETGDQQGRRITRDASFSAGFVNPHPTGRDHVGHRVRGRWETGGKRLWPRRGDRVSVAESRTQMSGGQTKRYPSVGRASEPRPRSATSSSIAPASSAGTPRTRPAVVTLLTPVSAGFVAPAPAPAATQASLLTWHAALALAYVAIALTIVAVRLRAWLRLRRGLAEARPVGRSIAGVPCPVLERPHLGPMVVGALRPRIVVPSELVAPDQAPALACVLGHEIAHVRRADAWLEHWFGESSALFGAAARGSPARHAVALVELLDEAQADESAVAIGQLRSM